MNMTKQVRRTIIGIVVGLLLFSIIWFTTFGHAVESWLALPGGWGIAISIAVMALFGVIPIPSEFIMVENVRIHGIWIGLLCNWLGAMIGALILFSVARYIRRQITFAPQGARRVIQLDHRHMRRRTRILLLLLARILPVPAKLVDIVAGAVKSISWWDFLWTTALGVLPYNLLAALAYTGFVDRSLSWLLGALVIFCLICIVTWKYRHWLRGIRLK